MNLSVFNPAVALLLQLQSKGKIRRLASRLLRPRHIVLTALAGLLLCAWVANALMSVFLREATDVASLRSYMALALTAYAAWHIVRVACFRPEQPLETTPEVSELLAECPLSSVELIGHHLAGTFTAAFFKAGCVALLLLPDLGSPLMGLAGILLALWFLDLVRIGLEIVAWGMSRRSFYVFRGAVVAALVTVCLMSLDTVREAAVAALAAMTHENQLESMEIFFGRLKDTALVEWCLLAWYWVLEVIAANRVSLQSISWLAVSCAVVGVMMYALVNVYGRVLRRVARREQAEFHSRLHKLKRASDNRNGYGTEEPQVRNIVEKVSRIGGIGPLAWRQLIGAYRHLGGLFTAMAVPGMLSLVPACAPVSNEAAFMSVVCGLAFYAFILLPTALRFDFRRDLERIVLVKSLPVGKFSAALGQIATPVVVASLFQSTVVTIALIARPVGFELVVGALAMLFTQNVLIFSLENLIFLWYPHRLQQEGIEIFLRTTLTFTAKGILFLVAVVAIVAWSVPARYMADVCKNALGVPVSAYFVYFLGIQFFLSASCFALIWLLARTFQRFDPVEDCAA